MAYYNVVAGATSQIIEFPIFDSSSTTGALKSGLTYSSMTAFYKLWNAASAVSMTLVTMTSGTWTSLGFVAADGTNTPGVYQLGIPNAALASGNGVTLYLTASGCVPIAISIQLQPVPANATQILGTAVSSPATAGILDVNVKNMNNVAATSITTINANQGTTQPINFTGTGGSALTKSDVTDWNGTAVSSPATAGIPDVNVKNMNNIAGTSITTISANQGTTQPQNFTGTGGSALVKVDVTDIATAAVNTGSAQLGVNVVSQANIDFGALQKTSLNAATPVATLSGDFSATMKTSLNNATPTVTAGTITAGAINNAAFNADVSSTAYASNTLAQMLYKFFDNAFTGYSDGSTFTSNGLLDRLTKALWIIRNQLWVTDSTGAAVIYKDDNSTSGLSTTLTDDATTTKRARAA